MANPYLTLKESPEFSAADPALLSEAINQHLTHCREAIATIKASAKITWESTLGQLEEAENQLSQAWSIASHLHNVENTEALRKAYEANLSKLAQYDSERNQDTDLCEKLKDLQKQATKLGLTLPQQTALSHELRDFKLSGVDLPTREKAAFAKTQEALSQLSFTYENHLLDATKAWHYHTEHAQLLTGLPEHTLKQAEANAKEANLTGWKLGLDIPTYLAVMTQAQNRELRAIFYQAYQTRASDQGPLAEKYDNTATMEAVLANRQEMARLLGFHNYAEVSLQTKMAQEPKAVINFLEDLARKSCQQAKTEFAALTDFATATDKRTSLASWDVSYYSERMQESLYQISQESLRPYFPLPKVLEGLFGIVKTLFGLTITKSQADTWNPLVQFFTVHDEHRQHRGAFYADFFARPTKRGGAWMDDYQSYRKTTDNRYQYPVAFLNCNFAPPSGDKPALLTHDDVLTLFHEFGHTLHHLASRVEVGSVSGIHGVAWDAVELPSQFMENFCWEAETLPLISSHIDTGEPLPLNLLQKLRESRQFQSAMQMVRQLEFSLFDMRIHLDPNVKTGADIQRVLDQTRHEMAVLIPPAFNRFQHSFSHIFAGGYGAGYYSYKWAEVLSADAFSRFQEEGILNPQTGRDFLHHILEKGGSEPADVLFARFRGRSPSIEALLKHTGIHAEEVA